MKGQRLLRQQKWWMFKNDHDMMEIMTIEKIVLGVFAFLLNSQQLNNASDRFSSSQHENEISPSLTYYISGKIKWISFVTHTDCSVFLEDNGERKVPERLWNSCSDLLSLMEWFGPVQSFNDPQHIARLNYCVLIRPNLDTHMSLASGRSSSRSPSEWKPWIHSCVSSKYAF